MTINYFKNKYKLNTCWLNKTCFIVIIFIKMVLNWIVNYSKVSLKGKLLVEM